MEREILPERPLRLIDAVLVGACGIGAGFLLDLDHAIQCRLSLGRAPLLWEIHECGSRFLHLPVLYLSLLVSGAVGAYLVGRIASLALEGRGATIISWLALIACGLGGLFVMVWLALSLKGWLVWAVIGAVLMMLAHAAGWLAPILIERKA